MSLIKYILFVPVLVLGAGPASAAIMHAFSAVSVPVDAPWALGALGALVAIVVARAMRKR